MKRRKRNGKKLCGYMSSVLLASQAVCAVQAQAEQLEYEGTTQITSTSYYLDVDTFAVELEVAEVYAQSGSTISQGDQILKLTEESYQEAVAYYAAALIRAENNLTDVQLEYDQGMLETQYTYETAQAKAAQAEFIREYQQKELEDTIAEHEEVLEELEERIAELESEIASGSFDSTTSSSGTSGGSSSSGGSSGSAGRESELDGEQESEPESETGDQPGTGTDGTGDQPGTGTDGTGDQPGTGTDGTGDQPGTGTDGTGDQPGTGTDGTGGSGNSGGSETDPGASGGADGSGASSTDSQTLEAQIADLETQLEEKNQEYQEVVEKIEALGLQISGEEATEETQEKAGEQGDTKDADLSGQLEDSIDGDTNVKTNLENVQKNLSSVPEAVMEVVKAAYPNYEDYIELLDQCIQQLQADIQIQEAVKEAMDDQKEESASDLDEEELESLLSEMYRIGTEKSELYGQLISLQETWLQELLAQADGETESETGTDPGADGETETDTGAQTESETETGSETEDGRQPGEDRQQESESGQDESGDGQGGSGMAGGGSSSAGSGSMSGMSQASGASETAVSSGSSTQQMGAWTVSEEDISLFGDTYDLTQVQNLLEREASDSDTAETLLEELEESRETVEEQYQELTRERKITELGIQYTYDTSVISGKLAEFTYQEEKQDWEEQLAEAKAEKEELEAEKAFLDSMADGILTADRDGTVAEIAYEEGDTITGADPVITYYDMDTVTISIQVPQEEIAALAVGDTVTVTISGMRDVEGTVAEKVMEPVSGTSRTTVAYQVDVTVDNSDERLSAGLSASVAVSAEQEEAQTEE